MKRLGDELAEALSGNQRQAIVVAATWGKTVDLNQTDLNSTVELRLDKSHLNTYQMVRSKPQYCLVFSQAVRKLSVSLITISDRDVRWATSHATSETEPPEIRY